MHRVFKPVVKAAGIPELTFQSFATPARRS